MFKTYISERLSLIKPMEVVAFLMFVFMVTPGFPGVAFALSEFIAPFEGAAIGTFVLSFITWFLSLWIGIRARSWAERFGRIKEFGWKLWRHVTEMQDMNRMEFTSFLLFFTGDLLFLALWPLLEKAFV